jgi:hypothetical protein
MRAMTWCGVGSAAALQYQAIEVGHQYVQGHQWPRFSDPQLFTPGVVYTITGVLELAPLPIPTRGKYGAPVPWDQSGGFPSPMADPGGYVTFDQDLGTYAGGARYPAGTWVAVTFLQFAQRIH